MTEETTLVCLPGTFPMRIHEKSAAHRRRSEHDGAEPWAIKTSEWRPSSGGQICLVDSQPRFTSVGSWTRRRPVEASAILEGRKLAAGCRRL